MRDEAPELVVIDGSVSATRVSDTADVDGIKRLYNGVREAIDGRDASVVVLHHERKPNQDHGRGDAAFAAHGSVYWQNLADLTYAVQKKSSEREDTDTGCQLRTVVEFEVTKPLRTTAPPHLGYVEFLGEFGPDGELLTTTVAATADPVAAEVRQAILDAGEPDAAGQPSLGRIALAEALDMKDTARAFQAGLKAALADGLIAQDAPRQPYYVPTAEPDQPEV
jgi:hypothetical protein